MLIRTEEGKADTCLCGLGEVKDCKWIQCGNGKCSSPWWHRKCANVSSYTEEEIEKMDFLCPLCIISNKKFENQLKVVVANRQLEEAEMPHTSLPTTTEVANRQLNEAETTHTSLPTSKAMPSADKAAPVSQPAGAGGATNQPSSDSKVTKSLCIHYKRGKCRHGTSGKRIFNGRECMYLHPKKCAKFGKYGYDEYNGCDGSCGLFHPTLCRNAVRFGKCFYGNCTFVHPVGTEHLKRNFSQSNLGFNNVQKGYNGFSNFPIQTIPEYGRRNIKQKENEGFVYNQNNFPPLKSFPPSYRVQEDKMNKMSSAIQNIQTCLDVLMRKNSQDLQQSFFPNHTEQQQTMNQVNPPYPVNNHLPVPVNEAKNFTSQHYYQ